MDLKQLLSRLGQIDQPTTEGGCGMDSPMAPPPMSTVPPKPDVPPPSMSVNINAQGLDNIEDMMKLFTKVNPDMMPKAADPMPTMSVIAPIGGDKPMGPPEIKPINKLLPDFDADNDDKPGGEIDIDMDLDKDISKKKEQYANEPDEEYRDISASIHDGTDDHREKGTYPKVAGGDNPMQKFKESGDLRAQIRAELLQRLAEAKGAK
jgi:hypothetical protein